MAASSAVRRGTESSPGPPAVGPTGESRALATIGDEAVALTDIHRIVAGPVRPFFEPERNIVDQLAVSSSRWHVRLDSTLPGDYQWPARLFSRFLLGASCSPPSPALMRRRRSSRASLPHSPGATSARS